MGLHDELLKQAMGGQGCEGGLAGLVSNPRFSEPWAESSGRHDFILDIDGD